MRDLDICRANIERCLEHVMTGEAPSGGSVLADFEGALQGFADWCAELRLLEEKKLSTPEKVLV